jgi:hypothetical protein
MYRAELSAGCGPFLFVGRIGRELPYLPRFLAFTQQNGPGPRKFQSNGPIGWTRGVAVGEGWLAARHANDKHLINIQCSFTRKRKLFLACWPPGSVGPIREKGGKAETGR